MGEERGGNRRKFHGRYTGERLNASKRRKSFETVRSWIYREIYSRQFHRRRKKPLNFFELPLVTPAISHFPNLSRIVLHAIERNSFRETPESQSNSRAGELELKLKRETRGSSLKERMLLAREKIAWFDVFDGVSQRFIFRDKTALNHRSGKEAGIDASYKQHGCTPRTASRNGKHVESTRDRGEGELLRLW